MKTTESKQKQKPKKGAVHLGVIVFKLRSRVGWMIQKEKKAEIRMQKRMDEI